MNDPVRGPGRDPASGPGSGLVSGQNGQAKEPRPVTGGRGGQSAAALTGATRNPPRSQEGEEMTETASGRAGRGGSGGKGGKGAPKSASGGLKSQRIYTTPGVHPYAEVTWERRDVVMTNWRDGSVNFEQRGVEFPDFWSVNAANIVTTKYFRGAVGTPQREWSLKQLVDRVTGAYVAAGKENGYFAADEDAEIFEHELKYALIHQVFSFNSPVWFNVGTASPQQVSACQPYDALVSTPGGLLPIGKLVKSDAVGTKVYDAHGLTRIVATKSNGVKDVLRLFTKAGYTLDVTADHLVWRAENLSDGGFVAAGSLRPGNHLLRINPEVGGLDRQLAEIQSVEALGPMEVYDIQTESGEYLSGSLRVHNCFILAVDDTMDSILDWYKEEGLIFKGGSGSGVNLSRIRSSKELLSSGGTASGPVSFMRGADASAGTIKSGGATRRAAKMVVLDVDHPDVGEFIETKAREEEKIRVLRDAGFDMDLGGKDITSVQYQNANNSVRVSDEFMAAVESGGEFDLLARRTGEVVERIDAKTLFRKMAQAAWECADPGIQYDGTINDWHTCPETGRITASNPCFPADQRVVTDKGLIRIGDLIQRAASGKETFAVYTNDVTSEVSPTQRVVASTPLRYMVTGTNEIVELRFSDGSRLRCTPNHRIWTANQGWVRADALSADDRVVRSLQYAARSMSSEQIPSHAHAAARAVKSRKELSLPQKWDQDFAHYLGWLIGDGCIDTQHNAVTVYGADEERNVVLPRHRALLTRITGFESKPSRQGIGTMQLRATRRAFVRFLEALGVAHGRAPVKRVPEAIYEVPEDVLVSFLQGLFDADGCVVNLQNSTRYVGLGSRSEELLIGVQELLSSLGIASRIYETGIKKNTFSYTRKDGSQVSYGSSGPCYDLRITGRAMREFSAEIGFSLQAKQQKLTEIGDSTRWYETDDTIRLVSRVSQGYETTYNLTEPRNHSYIVSGVVVANCSEYIHLDNSSCNLASINLLKFLRADNTFDTERFQRIVELIITAMDISITFADFPTEKIAETTRAYRQLGIGYANLGALLMATGHAYDSAGGRAIAAAITSLMTGQAYKRSAELAAVVGQYDGYARNAAAHKRVMRKHAAANDEVRTLGGMDQEILDAATAAWRECLALGETNGYRNAQSSLLAPTGTIGLMMDCDTTGVEPDLALVKFKKLVGGGSMQIVNQTVPRALSNLGYQPEQIEAIVEYIAEHGHVVNAPGLRAEHYEVFDCAMGERAIKPMGHISMMAATQPFLSGAISKTVNVPETATVEDVENIYFEGWKLGLKALAIYRDNCKVGQPLSDARKKADAVTAAEPGGQAEPREVTPVRRRLPKQRTATVTSFSVGGAEGYMTASTYPDDGLGEVFLKLGKQGSTLAGVMDAFSIAISISLQYGVPLRTWVEKFTNMRFEPAGLTDDPDIRIASSVMDYIFRRVALDHLPYKERAELGILSAAERSAQLSGEDPAELAEADPEAMAQSAPVEHKRPERLPRAAEPRQAHSSTELIEEQQGRTADAPLCLTCGTKMRPAGSCYVCEGCGSTSGCS
jgi:ribonucleoside-diphosphate reductase alpha chain